VYLNFTVPPTENRRFEKKIALENTLTYQKEYLNVVYDPEGTSYTSTTGWHFSTSDYIVLTILLIIVGTIYYTLKSSPVVHPQQMPPQNPNLGAPDRGGFNYGPRSTNPIIPHTGILNDYQNTPRQRPGVGLGLDNFDRFSSAGNPTSFMNRMKPSS